MTRNSKILRNGRLSGDDLSCQVIIHLKKIDLTPARPLRRVRDGPMTAPKLAEKALFDLLYLSPTRSRLFASLPEMELPKSFRSAEVARWTKKIAGKSRRTFVERKLESLKSAHAR